LADATPPPHNHSTWHVAQYVNIFHWAKQSSKHSVSK
jgi:hypothetical protein